MSLQYLSLCVCFRIGKTFIRIQQRQFGTEKSLRALGSCLCPCPKIHGRESKIKITPVGVWLCRCLEKLISRKTQLRRSAKKSSTLTISCHSGCMRIRVPRIGLLWDPCSLFFYLGLVAIWLHWYLYLRELLLVEGMFFFFKSYLYFSFGLDNPRLCKRIHVNVSQSFFPGSPSLRA